MAGKQRRDFRPAHRRLIILTGNTGNWIAVALLFAFNDKLACGAVRPPIWNLSAGQFGKAALLRISVTEVGFFVGLMGLHLITN